LHLLYFDFEFDLRESSLTDTHFKWLYLEMLSSQKSFFSYLFLFLLVYRCLTDCCVCSFATFCSCS